MMAHLRLQKNYIWRKHSWQNVSDQSSLKQGNLNETRTKKKTKLDLGSKRRRT